MGEGNISRKCASSSRNQLKVRPKSVVLRAYLGSEGDSVKLGLTIFLPSSSDGQIGNASICS